MESETRSFIFEIFGKSVLMANSNVYVYSYHVVMYLLMNLVIMFFFVFLVSRVTCSIFQLQDKTEDNKEVH